ncbi:efflux transporter outer membrane subunit [Acidovorax sp. Leaf78]|uniref:efflux transporter outer membrane subunit n=1 Tax=Acidovorax sp. Leaf78 TaxID=1736237 RepID=UPI00190FF393|nr:efflux transporter outer membrane subunit [Acidovorax sp. Leaf78]
MKSRLQVTTKHSLPLLPLALALLLVGCAGTRTAYKAPDATVPSAWQQQQAAPATAAQVPDQWWRQFNEPALTQVVEAALVRNNDLAAAALRVRQAQLQAGIAATALAPTVAGRLSSSASRRLEGVDNSTVRSSGASLSVSYEVDLWGRVASTRDAAEWAARATAEDREAAAQALAGTSAGLYWQLAYLNQRVASGGDSLAYAQRTQELVRAQYDAGSVSALELREAEQTVASQRAALAQLEQQRVETRNAVAVLMNAPPGAATLAEVLPTEPQRLPEAALPPVAAGAPAELLARRPDLRAAEARLRNVLASGDATRASYYPALSLTGDLGTSSTSLLRLLSNPVAALGAGLSLPFLRAQEMKLSGQLAAAQYEEAVTNFRQTLYTALADVENALSARTQLLRQGEQLALQLTAAREAERLYEVRYRAGATGLRTWLDAQQRRRTAELAVQENQLSQLNALATLYRVLGGAVVPEGR